MDVHHHRRRRDDDDDDDDDNDDHNYCNSSYLSALSHLVAIYVLHCQWWMKYFQILWKEKSKPKRKQIKKIVTVSFLFSKCQECLFP